MNVNPTLKEASPPDLRRLLDFLKTEVSKGINCVRPGIIRAFDAATQTATVQIAQQKVTSIKTDGTKTLAEFSLLLKVPVMFPSGGGCTLTFPVQDGDECILLFNDRDLDNWFIQGAGLPPATPRLHDLSDAFCIVGIRSKPRALANVSTTKTQLRTDSGLSFVEIDPDTETLKVHAGTVYEWDVHGYGQKITWTGGSNYTIDNYTIGAVITTNNHPITPPGPP